MKKYIACVKLLRVHQWTKNLFIFLPGFFGLRLTNSHQIINCLIAFLSFSFVASSVYIFNDFLDIESDRLHHTKKNRPLANGTVSKPLAITLMFILLAAGLGTFTYLGSIPLFLVLFYVIQNIAYCVKLKNYPIIDVAIISVGFVLCIFIGGAVTHTALSHWIVLMTFLLAMFLSLAKRRDDVLIVMKGDKATRYNAYGYNLDFLNNRSGSPTIVLIKDTFLQAMMAGWVITIFVLFYIKPSFNGLHKKQTRSVF